MEKLQGGGEGNGGGIFARLGAGEELEGELGGGRVGFFGEGGELLGG